LQGKETREDALFRPDEWWEEQQIELLRRTSVLGLDVGSRVARLSNKQEVSFDKALIATGANVRRLGVPGGELDGIHYLRTIGNSKSIWDDAEEAASLTARGKSCAIVMMEDVTLERFYGQEVGRFLQGVLEEHGIAVHGGDQLERFEGSDRSEEHTS